MLSIPQPVVSTENTWGVCAAQRSARIRADGSSMARVLACHRRSTAGSGTWCQAQLSLLC